MVLMAIIINYNKSNLTHGRGESQDNDNDNDNDNEDIHQLYVNLVNEKPNHKKNKKKRGNRFDGLITNMGYMGEYNIADIRDKLFKKIKPCDNILIYGNSIICIVYMYAICAIAMRKNINNIILCNYDNQPWTSVIINPKFQIKYIDYEDIKNMNSYIIDSIDTKADKIICHKSDVPKIEDKKNIIIMD